MVFFGFCLSFGGKDDAFKQSWTEKCEKFKPLGMESRMRAVGVFSWSQEEYRAG